MGPFLACKGNIISVYVARCADRLPSRAAKATTAVRELLRLRHRRRRLRRLRAGQPAVRGPGRQRPAARGRRPRQLSLDPHPDRLSVLHQQSAHRLDVPDARRADAQRTLAAVSARPRAGRQLVDQRHDLHARPARGLRRLGAPRSATRAGAGTPCCRCSSAAKITTAARPSSTAPAANGAWKRSGCAGTSSRRSRAPASRPASRKRRISTRGDNFGVGYFEVNQRRGVRWNASKAFLRPVRTRAQLTVLTGAQVDAPRRWRAGAARDLLSDGGERTQRRARTRGGDPGRRRDQFAAAARADRHRRAARCCGVRHRVVHRLARRRREPAGSPAAALRR